VVRALFQQGTVKRIYGVLGLRQPEAYQLRFPECAADVFVLGPYQTATGGCDRIQHYERIPPLIEKYAARGHVIFEGVIVSSTYGQVGALLERWGKQAVMLTLDTPLEECVRRVNVRRGPRGALRHRRHLIQKYYATLDVAEKVEKEEILRAITTNSDAAPALILRLLREAPSPPPHPKALS
jgi:hypothetical protein